MKRRVKHIRCIETHTLGTFHIKEGVLGEVIEEEADFLTIRVQQSFIYNFKRIHMSRMWKHDIRTHLALHDNFSKEYLNRYDNLPQRNKTTILIASTVNDDISDEKYIAKIKALIDKGCMDNALC